MGTKKSTVFVPDNDGPLDKGGTKGRYEIIEEHVPDPPSGPKRPSPFTLGDDGVVFFGSLIVISAWTLCVAYFYFQTNLFDYWMYWLPPILVASLCITFLERGRSFFMGSFLTGLGLYWIILADKFANFLPVSENDAIIALQVVAIIVGLFCAYFVELGEVVVKAIFGIIFLLIAGLALVWWLSR